MASFSIMLPVARADRKVGHGDYFYGSSLARALERREHTTQVLAVDEWHTALPDDIALHIRGRAPVTRRFGRLCLSWCISFFPKPDQPDYDHVDHFFAASEALQKRIARRAGKPRASLMYQSFDPDFMYPTNADSQSDLVFVGTPRTEERRPVVPYAAESGLPFRLYGPGWDETPFASHQAGGGVRNEDLGDIYRSSGAVINDHLVIMRRLQIGSNRIYDGLACGRPVLNDVNAGLPDDILPFVLPYSDAESFREQAARALSESAERRAERAAFATCMRATHSFDQRAEQILAKIDELGG